MLKKLFLLLILFTLTACANDLEGYQNFNIFTGYETIE